MLEPRMSFPQQEVHFETKCAHRAILFIYLFHGIVHNELSRLQLKGEATVNHSLTVELTLWNPLPEPLHECSFTIEGVGLTDGKPITSKYVNHPVKSKIWFRCGILITVFFKQLDVQV